MSIYDRIHLRKAKFMFKVYNNIVPTYISESFTQRNNVNTRINLRSSSAGCFIPPKPRLVGWLVGFVALRPKSTAMVIAGRSVHLTTLFPGQA